MWAVPCVEVKTYSPGLITLVGAQIDSVILDRLPEDVTFDVAIRLVGRADEFAVPHAVRLTLTAPDLVELGQLEIPVEPGVATGGHIAGYEMNRHIAARVVLPADAPGGYDLAFGLDGDAAHHHRATMSVVLKPAS